VGLRERIAALLGLSAYTRPRLALPSLGSPVVDAQREMFGGALAPIPVTQSRWYLADLEAAEAEADGGSLAGAARLMRAARRDGVYAGALSTRTSGLVRLPKRFRGLPEVVEVLAGRGVARPVFDEMFPARELALLEADGLELGVGVGELVPVEGRDHPVFVRLDPEFLVYRWTENQWYYRSILGLLPITPGDGRWILHTPGGRLAPWQHGIWRAVGRAYVRKEHALLHRDNWEGKLANPARVAVAPAGSAESEAESWFQRVMAWGVNTVFGMRPGYDVKLLESNGRGAESFRLTIEEQNRELILVVQGQTVTTDGGAGFSNSDVHRSIRGDLIQDSADGLAFTINTQGLPSYVIARWGEAALEEGGAGVEWDTALPQDRTREAAALASFGTAIRALTEALDVHGRRVDVDELCSAFGVPVRQLEAGETRALEAQAAADRPRLALVGGGA